MIMVIRVDRCFWKLLVEGKSSYEASVATGTVVFGRRIGRKGGELVPRQCWWEQTECSIGDVDLESTLTLLACLLIVIYSV